MKKKIKSLIIAASVAAIAGIAAVSFAYWNAGSGSEQGGANGSTGNTVSTLGGLTVTYNGNADDLAEGATSFKVNDKLVPYDQKDGTAGHAILAKPAAEDTWKNVHYMVFEVTNGNDANNGQTVYKINGGLVGTESNPVGNAKLMYKVGEFGEKDEDGNTVALESISGYTNITAVPTQINGFTGNSAKITVIMVANGADAKDVNWNITFSASENTGLVTTGYDMKANGTLVANLEEVNASASESVVYCAPGVELKANDVLTFAIKGKDTSSIKGADDSDPTKAGQATVTANEVKVTADGTFDVYFKQKTGNTTDWFVWVQYAAPTDGRVSCGNGVYLVGQFVGDPAFFWDYGWATTLKGDEYVIEIELKVGDVIKFRNGVEGYGYDKLDGNTATKNCFKDLGGNDRNIEVLTAGTYTFYFKADNTFWVEKA